MAESHHVARRHFVEFLHALAAFHGDGLDGEGDGRERHADMAVAFEVDGLGVWGVAHVVNIEDRKSTRLNSSHANISYAVFCLKKKTKTRHVPAPSNPSTCH